MTKFILSILLLSAPLAQALPLPQTPTKPFELMKCVSQKHGTIWASFGRQRRSDSDLVRVFPTEIVVFAPDYSARLLFPDFREALKIPVRVSPGSMSMEFVTVKGDITKTNTLQISQYDQRDDSGYLGNWIVQEAGQRAVYDQVGCSLN